MISRLSSMTFALDAIFFSAHAQISYACAQTILHRDEIRPLTYCTRVLRPSDKVSGHIQGSLLVVAELASYLNVNLVGPLQTYRTDKLACHLLYCVDQLVLAQSDY